ncbi:MAG: AAA family ATPase, partial [Planctomycetota bacterium]|nr:AAA family ATPase [Planctomycetota bacterium]
MKFLELTLPAFGPFEDLSLDLSEIDNGVHVFLGSNEAGKSTTLRAVFAMLFGIPHNTVDAHKHKMPKLRIGATLANKAGETLQFLRRKGHRNTLLDNNGKSIPDEELKSMLGGINGELFQSIFGLSHESLQAGGLALLEGQGDVGESLFGAGLGGSHVHRLLEGLGQSADKIYSPRASKKPVNKALSDLKKAQALVRERSLPARTWLSEQSELKEAIEKRDSCLDKTRQLESKIYQLERYRQLLPVFAKRRQILNDISELGETVELNPDNSHQRLGALQVIRESKRQEDRLREELIALLAQCEKLSQAEALVAEQVVMNDLNHNLGSHLKADKDMPRVWGETRLIEDDLEQLLRNLGRNESLKDVESLRFEAGLEARVQNLALKRAGLDERLAGSKRELESLEQRILDGETELGGLHLTGDRVFLRLAIKEARGEGQLDRLIRDSRQAQERLTQDIERLYGALHIKGPRTALENFQAPSLDQLELFARSRRELKDKAEQLNRQSSEREKQRDRVTRQIATMTISGSVPTEADLLARRQDRDASLNSYSQSPTSKSQWEEILAAIADCDEISDRLRREADRVAQLARLLAEKQSLEHLAERQEREKESLQSEQASSSERWSQLWTQDLIPIRDPEDMRHWLTQFQRLKDLEEQQKHGLAAVEALAQRRRHCIDEIREALSSYGQEIPSELSIASALEHAQNWEAVVNRGENRQADLKTHLQNDRRALAQVKRDHQSQRNALSDWQNNWSEAMSLAGLGPDTNIAEATAILDQYRVLFRKQDERMKLLRRFKGMKNDSRRFAENVLELVTQYAPDLSQKPASQAATELLERFHKGREDLRLRKELTRQIEDKQALLSEVQENRQRAEDTLDTLKNLARCESLEELEKAERRSTALLEFKRELRIQEEHILELGDGSIISELLKEISAINAAGLPGQILDVKRALEEQRQQLSTLDEDIGGRREKLAHSDGQSTAADAALDAEDAKARARDGLASFLRLKLAER